MNILIAPNSMKGSLDAFEFADIVEKAFMECSGSFKVRKLPVADGGDFTGKVLKHELKASDVKLSVTGPLGHKVDSMYSKIENIAIIEMADASGMKLVDSNLLNPLKASSYGTGELIDDAIANGCSEIYLAIGGSATVDGGMGMMEALGFRFLAKDGTKLKGNGENLSKVDSIISSQKYSGVSIKILCDVDNVLLGEEGAAAVFGPQKGATEEMVKILEKGLKNWSQIIETASGKQTAFVEGAGAAGGISVPLLAFFDAEIVPGADFILEKMNFQQHVKWADLVITGEGKIDAQTLNQKAPFVVSSWAKKENKKVLAIGGKVEKIASDSFDGMFSFLNGPMDLDYAMSNSRQLLHSFSFELAKTIKNLAL